MSPATASPGRIKALLALAFMVSGAGALMLEVVWSRKLHLLFGGSAVAVSAVLAAYMGGLALGSVVVAPWIRRRAHGLLAYGVMELTIAGYALFIPWMLGEHSPLQAMLGLGGGSAWMLAAVRFAASALTLLLPTTLMGATLPCLADLVAGQDHDGARDVGLLYAANTTGAVLGTLGATFVAFPTLGVAGTNLAAASLDVVAGCGALWGWVKLGRPNPTMATKISSLPAAPTPRALWAYGVSGAVAMALEVLWTRSLSMVLGSSIHAFSLMLAAFLLGLALGSRAASSAAWTRLDARMTLAWVMAGTGVAAFVGTALVDQLPWVVWTAARNPDVDSWSMWATMLFCSALVMFPAALGFGAVLPCALRAAGAGQDKDLGALVGRAYAINTAGAIAGSLAAGFILAPAVGVDRGLQGLCVVMLGAGALLAVEKPVANRRALAAGVMMACAAVMLLWDGFDVGRWSVGAFRVYLAKSAWADGLPSTNVIFRRDGLSTTVTVEEYDGRVSLKVNGKTDASSEGDMPTQVLSGLLPVMLHPDPRRAAIIGFGSGVTSDALLSYDGIQELDMVELEPAVVEAGQFFSTVNHSPWTDPRYHGVLDDGRHHISRPGAPYDIIISEPSNPWITGASNLFTREFWTIARGRLAPHGVFLQWVQLYELSTERIQALMGTFADVFPYVLVFAAHPESNDTFLLGSNEPLFLHETLLKDRWSRPKVRYQLHRAELRGPLDVLSLALMDRTALDSFTGGHAINTDDNMYVELHAPEDLISFAHKEPELPFMRGLQGKRAALLERVARLEPRAPQEKSLMLSDVMFRAGMQEDARAFAADLVGAGEPWESRRDRTLEAVDVLMGNDEMSVVDEHSPALQDPRFVKVAKAMVDGHDKAALELFEGFPGMEKEGPDHRLLYAYLQYRTEHRWRAKQAVEPLLRQREWLGLHPEGLFYGAKIMWLSDENQTAAQLAYRFVDARAAKRKAAVHATLAAPPP